MDIPENIRYKNKFEKRSLFNKKNCRIAIVRNVQ